MYAGNRGPGGAFYADGSLKIAVTGGSNIAAIRFDASRFCDVYSTNGKVRPLSYAVLWYMKY